MTATMHIPKNSIRPLELFSIILSTYLCLLTLATICTKINAFCLSFVVKGNPIPQNRNYVVLDFLLLQMIDIGLQKMDTFTHCKNVILRKNDIFLRPICIKVLHWSICRTHFLHLY